MVGGDHSRGVGDGGGGLVGVKSFSCRPCRQTVVVVVYAKWWCPATCSCTAHPRHYTSVCRDTTCQRVNFVVCSLPTSPHSLQYLCLCHPWCSIIVTRAPQSHCCIPPGQPARPAQPAAPMTCPFPPARAAAMNVMSTCRTNKLREAHWSEQTWLAGLELLATTAIVVTHCSRNAAQRAAALRAPGDQRSSRTCDCAENNHVARWE